MTKAQKQERMLHRERCKELIQESRESITHAHALITQIHEVKDGMKAGEKIHIQSMLFSFNALRKEIRLLDEVLLLRSIDTVISEEAGVIGLERLNHV